MKNIASSKFILLPALATLALSGCATFRGMPSHGGGKRFDEEQRVVTAAIRHAAQKMDFSRIKSRKIALEVTSLETSGTGQAFYPGLGKMSGYYENSREVTSILDTKGIHAKQPAKVKDLGRWVPNYEFNPSLKANNNITRQDVNYLQRALEMRLRHEGFQIVPLELADVYLVVLVDALGTNLSRKDYGVAYDDDLGASCEMTYYAIEPQSQKVIMAAKAVASKGTYLERNFRFTPFRCYTRNVRDFNGIIAPLPTGSGASRGGGNVGVYVNPTKQKLNALVQEADIALEANDKKRASKIIGKIKKIDPNYPDLPELKQALKQL